MSKIDAVAIATPAETRGDIIRRALNTKKPVLTATEYVYFRF
tara:strand:+ start:394 stop:519 length:126 start_codon:yes stop_codon:yes gene_type:complete